MAKGRICVIDDKMEEFLMPLKRKFDEVYKNMHGYELHVTTEHQAAIEMVENGLVDTMVADLDMPHMNGFEFLKKIHGINDGIKLILITREAISENIQRGCDELGITRAAKNNNVGILLKSIFLFINHVEEVPEFDLDQDFIFVSYLSEDQSLVNRMVTDLSINGVVSWVDRRVLKPSNDWRTEIELAIKKCKFFVVCFSKSYDRRRKRESHMNEEIQLALEHLRRLPEDEPWLLPVKLEKCLTPKFRINSNKDLDSLHFALLYENWEEGISQIASVIKGN